MKVKADLAFTLNIKYLYMINNKSYLKEDKIMMTVSFVLIGLTWIVIGATFITIRKNKR